MIRRQPEVSHCGQAACRVNRKCNPEETPGIGRWFTGMEHVEWRQFRARAAWGPGLRTRAGTLVGVNLAWVQRLAGLWGVDTRFPVDEVSEGEKLLQAGGGARWVGGPVAFAAGLKGARVTSGGPRSLPETQINPSSRDPPRRERNTRHRSDFQGSGGLDPVTFVTSRPLASPGGPFEAH